MNRLFLVLALVIVSRFDALAQAPFFQDKTMRIVAGYGAGSVDDAWTRMIARYLGEIHSGKSEYHCAEHARSRRHDRGELCLTKSPSRTGSLSAAFAPGSISINSSAEKRFSSIGQSLPGSAPRPRSNRSSISAPTRPTKQSRTCAKHRSRPNVAPPE